MPGSHRHLDDPRALAAVAHPLRIAILERLATAGPLTASQLGEALAENPSNCSWHLRQLEKHGFVERTESSGRERPWRILSTSFSLADDSDDARLNAASTTANELMYRRVFARFLAAVAAAPREPRPWRRAASDATYLGYLTAAELGSLNRELMAVGERYAELILARYEDPAARPDDARLCEVVVWGMPVELEK